ncbi:MAG: hypothetical protein LBL05_06890 [Synergistaceae bacterium]|jgi:hypothetical protein|nr:hypothetical protein [Synergistaceae bacterium]
MSVLGGILDISDERQRGLLIGRIAQEVLSRLSALDAKDENVSGTVVLMTSHIPSPASAMSKLRENFGGELSFIDFGVKIPFGLPNVIDAGKESEGSLTETVASAAGVVLLAPKIGLLDSIAKGDDRDFIPYLVIRSMLWGRDVSVLLDFEPPRFRRNTFFEKLADTFAILQDMGVRLLTYKCAQKGAEGLCLVTEADVTEAWRSRRTEIRRAPGAIITPAAKDKAGELGIRLN